jgi:hypothetical protein
MHPCLKALGTAAGQALVPKRKEYALLALHSDISNEFQRLP